MKKLLICISIAVFLLLSFSIATLAETSALDWGLFKIYNSPAWVWGQNGAIITPTPEVSPNGVSLSGYLLNTGTYNNEIACFSTNTLQLSTGNLEIGITGKSFLLNWERLDVDSTILHIKFQPFQTGFLNIAVGSVAVQIGPNPFEGETKDKFFNNVFATAGFNLGGLSLNGGAEVGMIGNEQTKPFYFINAKLDHFFGPFALVVEAIATDEQGKGGIYNAALATTYDNINFGVGALDVSGEKPQLTVFGSLKY